MIYFETRNSCYLLTGSDKTGWYIRKVHERNYSPYFPLYEPFKIEYLSLSLGNGALWLHSENKHMLYQTQTTKVEEIVDLTTGKRIAEFGVSVPKVC